MHLDHYDLITEESLTFHFVSEGRKGSVVKVIEFQKTIFPDLYNLAFGDKNTESGEIDDEIVTDNGDLEKVLATVVAAIYQFATKNPGAWIYAIGSTPSRTRLYKMGINKYYNIIANDFEIRGELVEEWEWYIKGKNYHALAARKKNK